MRIRFVILSVLASLLCTAATAQSEHPLEVGAQLTVLTLDPLGEKPLGVGVRASYDLPWKWKKLTIAPELEFNYLCNDSPGDDDKQLLAGIRTGIKSDKFGFFLKARPGLVHFGTGGPTHLAVDLGGVFEYYTSPRVAVRLDLGDTIIRFPKPVFPGSIFAKPAGWYHNEQVSFGVSFRF